MKEHKKIKIYGKSTPSKCLLALQQKSHQNGTTSFSWKTLNGFIKCTSTFKQSKKRILYICFTVITLDKKKLFNKILLKTCSVINEY